MDRALTGVVIDPGHGGTDPGAVGNQITEKDLNLKISKYMYDRFKELGIPVSITRTDDTTLSPNDRVKKILSFYGNGRNVVVISNHINAGGGEGKSVIVALNILNNTNTKASRLILKVLNSATANATNNLGLKKEDLKISECYIDAGTVYKRIKFGSRTKVDRRDKRTSHITVKVSDGKVGD